MTTENSNINPLAEVRESLARALMPFAEQPIAHFILRHTLAPNDCPLCGPVIRARQSLEAAGYVWDSTRQDRYSFQLTNFDLGSNTPDPDKVDNLVIRIAETPEGERVRMTLGTSAIRSIIVDTLHFAPIVRSSRASDDLLSCSECGDVYVGDERPVDLCPICGRPVCGNHAYHHRNETGTRCEIMDPVTEMASDE